MAVTSYKLPGGRRLVLAYHTPEQWAVEVGLRLRRLGCSDEYVRAYQEQLRQAKPV